jgi:hypothetical protein
VRAETAARGLTLAALLCHKETAPAGGTEAEFLGGCAGTVPARSQNLPARKPFRREPGRLRDG